MKKMATAGLIRSMAAGAALASLALPGFVGAPAEAAQIFIQQNGTAPAGGDPNIITDTSAFVVGRSAHRRDAHPDHTRNSSPRTH